MNENKSVTPKPIIARGLYIQWHNKHPFPTRENEGGQEMLVPPPENVLYETPKESELYATTDICEIE